ncbi:MAG: ABC transporter permease [Candidatus Heimdallarchaeum aukensis]|uniref:ABC transporter permease n=1 Tax=Candidatus Heimdallarchaeum aukensis TaxID=2876573 RepID=A0A9Y1BM07_9ARCH|nr:MAG: ABC transporter permease [Candidatus Heimdallarchaeum aukensis]
MNEEKYKTKVNQLKCELFGSLAVYKKSWQVQKRYPLAMFFYALSPLLWLLPHLIFSSALVGGRYSENLYSLIGYGDVLIYTSLGLVFMAIFSSSMWGTAYSFRDEEFAGTLENLYITPISRYSIILGKTLFYLSQALIGCIIQLIVIGIWYREDFSWTNFLLSSVFLLVGFLLIQGTSLTLIAFVFWQKEGWKIILLGESLILFITPVTFPIVVLPTLLQNIAKFNPLNYAIEGFRNAFLFGNTGSVQMYFLILILILPFATAVGITIFHFAEKWLRKKALIGQY